MFFDKEQQLGTTTIVFGEQQLAIVGDNRAVAFEITTGFGAIIRCLEPKTKLTR